MKKTFKYETTLDLVLRPIVEESVASKIKEEAKASSYYNNLLGSDGEDIVKSWDIIPVYADLAVVNQFNLNDEGIDTIQALKYHKQFRHKPINLEHNKQSIVGHITNTAFSRYPNSWDNLSIEELLDEKEPFYLSFAGVIYSKIFPKVSQELLNGSIYNSLTYGEISASWEVGFNNFVIAVGSEKLSECTLIEDEYKQQEYLKYLKKNGGTGYTKEGKKVSRLLTEEIYPWGLALTTTPAAEVSGINVLFPLETKDNGEETEDDNTEHYEDYATNLEKNENNLILISQSNNNSVTPENNSMNEEQFNALMAKIQESLASVADKDKTSGVVDQFSEVLREHGQVWQSKVEIEEAKATEALSRLATIEQELTTLQEKHELSSARVVELESAIATREAAETFNIRMKAIEDTFELSEAEIGIISKEVKDLSTDEAFAAYSDKMNILLSSKTKEAIAKCKEDKEKAMAAEKAKKMKESKCAEIEIETEEEDMEDEKEKEACASVEKVLENVEESTASITNTPSTETESLVQRLTKNWKSEDQVTVS